MNCKNCAQIVDGNFCSHCGQRTSVDKINLPNFLGEISGSVFQINRGLFYTLKELFLRPGHSIRAYLSGKRKNHFKPIAYTFTLSTIYFLLSQFTESGTFITDGIKGWSNYYNPSEQSESAIKQLETLNWFAKNYAYTILMLLPLYSLASYLAFFGKGFNYLEHFVLNAYITGQQAIFYSVSAVLILITKSEDLLITITLCISILYTFYVFLQFFSTQGRVGVVLRSALAYLLFLIMFSIALIGVFFILKG